MKTKINTVVEYNETDALNIVQWLKEIKLEIGWRIMNALGLEQMAFIAIRRLCNKLAATPINVNIIIGSSSYTISFIDKNDFLFKVKLFRPFRINDLCRNCLIDANGICNEYAYGPRLENIGGHLMVRSCIYHSEIPALLRLNDYFSSNIAHELYYILNKLSK